MHGKGLLPALRRGVGLGLTLVALWGVAQTADLPAVGAAVTSLGEDPALAASLLARQTGVPFRETAPAGIDGFGRLLLACSPLLSGAREDVAKLGQSRAAGSEQLQAPDGLNHDDIEEPDLQPPDADEGILEMTGGGKSAAQYLSQGELYLYNRTKLELTPAVLTEGSVGFTMGEGPQILIYHSHGSEAYAQTDGEIYTESDPYRTTDCTHNVVRVGEEIAQVFRACGFQVIHDANLYDYPVYSGSYDRSGAAVAEWLNKYPTIRLVLDVHRDALQGEDGAIYKLVSQEEGTRVAQVMFVVGTGESHPAWRDNLALAVKFQRELLSDYVSLARPIVLRASRYNQNLSPGSLLVEVGGHGNNLTEALAGARLFARSAAQVLLGMRAAA